MLRSLALSGVMFFATACTTLSSSSSSGPAGLDFADKPIVHQTSGKTLMKQISRDRWVSLRNSSKNEHIKLYANLGAAEWDVAISDARTYLEKNPKDEVALTVLSLALAMKQNYPLAAYYAKLLDKYHPGNPEVHNILGLAEMGKPAATFDNYKEAIREFETAFNSSDKQIASGMNLAQLHMEMGNLESARDVYAAVRGRCGECSEASLGYGITLSRLQSFSKAEEVFKDVLDSDKNDPFAPYYLALVAKYGRNDNDEAMSRLQAMLENPEIKNLEMQRKANFLLRRIQAQVYGRPKDKPIKATAAKPRKKAAPALSEVKSSDIENAINAE